MSRLVELNAEDGVGSSGFARLFYGYIVFNELPLNKQLWGASRTFAYEVHEAGFVNGISDMLFIHGYVGVFLLLLFYIRTFKSKEILPSAVSILFIAASAVEATYLGPLMVITAAIICSYKANK